MLPHKQLPRTCTHSSSPACNRVVAGSASRRSLRRSVAHATTQQVGESLQQSRTRPEEDAANAVVANFSVKGKVAFGEWLRLVGSSEEFGRWGPFEGPLLKWHDGDIWKASIKLPCDLDNLEFKVVVCHEQGGPPGWEQGPNRVLQVPSEPGVLEHSCDLGKIDSGRSTFFRYNRQLQQQQQQQQQLQQQQNGSTDAKQQAPSPSTNGKPSPQHLASTSQQLQQQQQQQQQQPQPQPNVSASQASGTSTLQGSSSSPANQDQDVPAWYSLLGSAAISAAAGAGCLLILALNEAATVNKQRAEALRAESVQAEQLRSFSGLPSSIPAPVAAPPLQGR